jgi:hypothetical protein
VKEQTKLLMEQIAELNKQVANANEEEKNIVNQEETERSNFAKLSNDFDNFMNEKNKRICDDQEKKTIRQNENCTTRETLDKIDGKLEKILSNEVYTLYTSTAETEGKRVRNQNAALRREMQDANEM